jgi:hypothetical protein
MLDTASRNNQGAEVVERELSGCLREKGLKLGVGGGKKNTVNPLDLNG